MDQQKAILQILQQSPEPLSWHGIEIRLRSQGIVVPGKLIVVIKELVEEGFLIYFQKAGYPHGVYSLTDLGRNQL